MRAAEVGRRLVDKLVQVWRLDGEEAWALVHIEIQSQEESGFAERMYTYHHRHQDRSKRPIVSMAVLATSAHVGAPAGIGARCRAARSNFRR